MKIRYEYGYIQGGEGQAVPQESMFLNEDDREFDFTMWENTASVEKYVRWRLLRCP